MKKHCNYDHWHNLGLRILLSLIGIAFFAAVPICQAAGDQRPEADLVWIEYDGQDYEIYYAQRGSGHWGPKMRLTNNTLDDVTPTVGATIDGTIWVIWSQIDGKASTLQYSRLEGGRWAPPRSISTHFSANTAPTLLIGKDQRPWLVWAGFDGHDDEIYYTRWNQDAWDPPHRINDDDSLPDILPTLALTDEGDPYVLWTGYADGRYQVFSARWKTDQWTSELPVSTHLTYHQMLLAQTDPIPQLPDLGPNLSKGSIHLRYFSSVPAIPLRILN